MAKKDKQQQVPKGAEALVGSNNDNNKKDETSSSVEKSKSPQQQKSAQKSISVLFLRLYFWFHIQWLLFQVKVYNWLHDISPAAQEKQEQEEKNNKNKKQRKIKKFLHIGDDVALGLGDWVTFMGDSGLNQYIELHQPLILSKWIKVLEARRHSTTEDWLPGNTLFEECFHPENGKHINANIIMITVGSNDVCTPASSGENLKAIVTTLRQRFPQVHIILNIPSIPISVRNRDDDSKVKQRVLLKSDIMREAIKQLFVNDEYAQNEKRKEEEEVEGEEENSNNNKKKKKKQTHQQKGPLIPANELASKPLSEFSNKGYVRFGVDLDQMFCHQPDAFALGDLFLKPRAYKDAVTRVLSETVLLTQKSVERSDLKKLLH